MFDMAGPHTKEVLITRIFRVSRQQVFKAWTDPKQLARWWGPEDFTNPVCLLNVVPGGGLYIVMHAPDGTDYPMNGIFLDIIVPELLVFTSGVFEDRQGNDQLELQHTVIFDENAAQTKLTVHSVVTRSSPGMQHALGRISEGWMQSLARLAQILETALTR
jgi:uncharacterized protein YndB with AHSA1/START domain